MEFDLETVTGRPLGLAIMKHFVDLMGPTVCLGIQDDVDAGYSTAQVKSLIKAAGFDEFVVECGSVYADMYKSGAIALSAAEEEEKPSE